MSLQKLFLCLIGVIVSAYYCKSQNNSVYTYRNYTTLNGLSSNEVYNVFCDSRGELWFSTANGASKFDGQSFTNYTHAQGLPNNTVLKLTEDCKGRVWVVSFSSGLAYIQNNKVYPFKYNKILEKAYTQSSETALGFLSSSCDSMLVAPYKDAITYVSFNGHSKSLPYLIENGLTNKSVAIQCFNDSIGELISYTKIIEHTKNTLELHYINKNGEDILLFTSDTIHSTAHDRVMNIGKDTWIYSNNKNAFLIKNGKVEKIYRFDGEILRIFQEGNSLLFGLRDKGLVRFNHYLDSDFSFVLKDLSVSGICTDKENGYWVSTLENGVYYIPTFNCMNVCSNPENKLGYYTSIVCNDSFIYCGTKNGQIEKWNKTKVHLLTIKPSDETGSIWKMYCDPVTKSIWLSASEWGGVIINDVFQKIDGVESSLSYLRKDDCIYNGHWASMLRFKNYRMDTALVYRSWKKIRFESLLDASRDELIIGSINGLYKFNSAAKSMEKFELKDSIYKQPRVVYMIKDQPNIFYLGTKGNGLLVVNNQGKILKKTDHSAGLLNDNITKIKSYKNFLFLLSENGISVIKKKPTGDEVVGLLDYSFGLYNSNFSDFEVMDDYLWAVGSKGIDVIDLTILNQAPKLLFRISGINISGKDTNGTSFTLPYNQNAITLKYQLVTYRNQERKIFRYRIVNRDSVWMFTKNTELNFVDLSPGKYKIEIAGSNGLQWSNPVVLNLKIESPFWIRWWFMVIEIFSVVLVVYFFLNNYFKKQRLKTDEKMLQKQHISELEMKALRAQINPHFIFNVLYSIQHYILFNQNEDAQKYLSKFARLLRSILQNSKENLVNLAEEIMVLELYLELEEMRFENKFTYRIQVEPKLNVNSVKIPTLLIQPMIENAVKHGVGHLKSGGVIKVDFKIETEKLICVIDDNGVGRAFHKNREKPFEDYKSMGMEITRNRMEIFGKQFSVQTKLSIVDKEIEKDKETGTRIIIELPIIK